jgi:transposase-like protein
MSIKSSILASFSLLSNSEMQQILLELIVMTEMKDSKILSIRTQLSESHIASNCPHCKSEEISKRGKKNGNQQFQCKKCMKSFSNTTGSSLHGIIKTDKFQQYLSCFLKGYSLDKICLEVGISKQTSFNWRHKILSNLKEKEPSKLGKIIECDEMEFPISEKGRQDLDRPGRQRAADFVRNDNKKVTTVQLITAIDREGNKIGKAVKTKRVTGKDLKKVLGKKMPKECTLITDEHPSYKKLSKLKTGINLKQVNSKMRVDRIDKKINIQKVNNHHKEIREFLNPFHGVGSKYLENYIQWCNYFKYEESANAYEDWITDMFKNKNGYKAYKTTNEKAEYFRL